MVNKVILIGTLGKDPDIRITQNSKVATFSLATNETYKSNGENKSVTEWHNIVIWGKLAEFYKKHRANLDYHGACLAQLYLDSFEK